MSEPTQKHSSFIPVKKEVQIYRGPDKSMEIPLHRLSLQASRFNLTRREDCAVLSYLMRQNQGITWMPALQDEHSLCLYIVTHLKSGVSFFFALRQGINTQPPLAFHLSHLSFVDFKTL